jgi:hypothetical protein
VVSRCTSFLPSSAEAAKHAKNKAAQASEASWVDFKIFS